MGHHHANIGAVHGGFADSCAIFAPPCPENEPTGSRNNTNVSVMRPGLHYTYVSRSHLDKCHLNSQDVVIKLLLFKHQFSRTDNYCHLWSNKQNRYQEMTLYRYCVKTNACTLRFRKPTAVYGNSVQKSSIFQSTAIILILPHFVVLMIVFSILFEAVQFSFS